MKKFLLGMAGFAVLGMSVPASAADLAVAPYAKAPPTMIAAIYDWSGMYIGLNGGGGTSHKCWDAITPAGALLSVEGCHNATGAVAGGQLGFRLQSSSFVFGVEAQGDWANLRGSSQGLVTTTITNRSRIDGLGLFTGQLGYAFSSVLLYVKGGAALTSDRYDSWTTAGNVLAANAGADNRWGGTVGAGLEFGFAPNWSAGLEYDHLFMGTRNTTFTSTGAVTAFPLGTVFATDRIRQDVDLLTVRVNYRWGGPLIAKY
jgi:outer membrane immunogenic protein